jgi:hypothetical protein
METSTVVERPNSFRVERAFRFSVLLPPISAGRVQYGLELVDVSTEGCSSELHSVGRWNGFIKDSRS